MIHFLLIILLILIAIVLVVLVAFGAALRFLGLDKLIGKLLGSKRSGQSRTGFTGQTAGQGGAQADQRRTTTAAGDVIIDRRTSEQVNRKIFEDNEGEYVDFKED